VTGPRRPDGSRAESFLKRRRVVLDGIYPHPVMLPSFTMMLRENEEEKTGHADGLDNSIDQPRRYL
jgi:hypothetical protein